MKQNTSMQNIGQTKRIWNIIDSAGGIQGHIVNDFERVRYGIGIFI